MRVRALEATASISFLLIALLFTASAVSAKDEPTIAFTEFDSLPANLNYFRESNVILFQEAQGRTIWRSTDGGTTWKKAAGIEHDKAVALIMHEYDPHRAYVLTGGNVHWRTHDRGETWEQFFTYAYTSDFIDTLGRWMVFHADDPDKIMFTGMDCDGWMCEELVMYTLDGFKTDAVFLRGRTQGCWWAKSSQLFTTGQDDLDDSRILCIVRGGLFAPQEDNRLFVSDNYFDALDKDGVIQEFEPNLNGDSPIQGIVSLVGVKKYLVAATSSRNTVEMALFVTDDTLKWHRAIFPHDHPLRENAYTVLESTNYSIQVDVRTSKHLTQPMGVLLTSNSNGTYFTRNIEHTNRNLMAYVDFEKVSGIRGIFLVNQVSNWEDVEAEEAEKKLKTLITFDDGRTFDSVKTGDDEIHLHSVTEINNVGPVFSSLAPGLIMGNGNHGDFLNNYSKSNLYISDDAGRTWIEGLKGPHKYEFGDEGSILLAIEDSEDADVGEIKYSLDHGQEWKSIKLPESLKISPWTLTTTQDSTSLKFVLTARKGSRDSPSGFYVFSIDFEGLHERTCADDDMEDWFARVDDDGEPSCVMGHTQKYHRRKKNADCFVKHEFEHLTPQLTPCDCTDADFECDFNFVKDGDRCKPAGPITAPNGACRNDDPDETFMGSSGFRLIPGNGCKRTGAEQKDKEKEWKCSESKVPPSKSSGKVEVKPFPFEGDFDSFEKHYLERGELSSNDDETIIARPYKAITNNAGEIWITHDHGKNWTQPKVLKGKPIWQIATHPYVKDMAFFLTTEGTVYYTMDRGRNFDSFKHNLPPDTKRIYTPLVFHPDRPDWLLWHGEKCDDDGCHLVASLSMDRGDNWETVRRYVEKCEFTGSSAFKFRNTTQIICLARKHEDNERKDNPLQMLYSDKYPEYELTVALESAQNFATMAEFIVVAARNETKDTLKALASINGKDYAPAHFPYNFEVNHTNTYTVLDSSTHAVNLFVATSVENTDRRFGTILKSNSNGTSYVLSVSGVNCNERWFVDFDKVLGLEGVALVNVVENQNNEDEAKRLQSKITHNDGAEWAFLPTPRLDSDQKSYECSSSRGDESCALHLHGYTERVDHGKTYSSESAVGLMFAIGNVGTALGDIEDADTFMTDDAGLTWREVKKGRWIWSIGEQGSIVVLAQRFTRTKTIAYSLNRGDTWEDMEIYDSEVVITDITTLRSGASRNFVLWARRGDEMLSINLDFSGLSDQACEVIEDDAERSDYELWSPQHPMEPNGCLFGHVNQYLRKKKDRTCYNSKQLKHLYNVENCECTRRDFECDYNYEMDIHGQCNLVEGLEPLDPALACADDPSKVEYYEPSGFRRIPLSTCKGGFEADKVTKPHACPGHEEQFEKKHGVSGIGLFFAIVLPFTFAAAVGWWVYRNYSSKFGQIRLGEQNTFDTESPWIKYPVMGVAGLVAVISATPLIVGSLLRNVGSLIQRVRGKGDSSGGYGWLRNNSQRRFTTRDSFARGSGDYDVVDNDEGELLGDESDEEI